jgi:hypothetical protein
MEYRRRGYNDGMVNNGKKWGALDLTPKQEGRNRKERGRRRREVGKRRKEDKRGGRKDKEGRR